MRCGGKRGGSVDGASVGGASVEGASVGGSMAVEGRGRLVGSGEVGRLACGGGWDVAFRRQGGCGVANVRA